MKITVVLLVVVWLTVGMMVAVKHRELAEHIAGIERRMAADGARVGIGE